MLRAVAGGGGTGVTKASLDAATPFVAPSKRISFAFLRIITPEKGLLGGAARLIVGGFVFGRFLLAAIVLFTLPTIALALLLAATGLARFEEAGPVVAICLGAIFVIAEIAPYLDPRRRMVRNVLRGRRNRRWSALRRDIPAPLAKLPARARRRTARARDALTGAVLQAGFLAALFAAFALFTHSQLAETEVVIDGEPTRVADLAVGLVVIAAFAAVFLWRRLRARSATRALAEDTRPPVLLLRPFEKDGKALPRVSGGASWMSDAAVLAFFDHFTTLENSLADVVDHFGPFIGIGVPGEILQTDGAAREYVSHADWRNYALSKMADSQRIVCVWGVSESFGWELDQIFSRGYLSKTVFIFPPERSNAFKKVDHPEIQTHKRAFLARLGLDRLDDAGVDQTVAACVTRRGPLALTAEKKYDSAYLAALLIAFLAAPPGRAAPGTEPS